MGGLTEAKLRALAGERSFERGLAYADEVSGVEFGDGWIRASVRGTERYQVELLLLGGRRNLAGTCDCPYGQEGNFCKHLVALGLTVIAQEADLPRRRKAARDRTRGLDAWLTGMSHADLLALVREEMAEDRNLRRRLELRAASARGDVAGIRSRIRELLDSGPFAQYGYVEYADVHAYADQALQAADAIRSVTASGRAADSIALAREAIGMLAAVVESVDDSDGRFGEIGVGLADAHHEACRAAGPDPEELAHWLVTHALDDAADLTDIDPLDYEDLLGERGMAALRRHAVEAWQANRTGWAEKHLMQRLAKSGRDIDTVIAVHAADLAPNGHTHLLIARELDTVGRTAEALEWAERGIRETEDLATVDTALIDHLADRYTWTGQPADAVTLRRDHFAARRTLLTYQQLRAAAIAAACWPTEREKALALLRADAERADACGGRVLVDILLDEGDVDAAWRAASEYGAHDGQWLTVADRSRPTRPADALAVYIRLVTLLTHETGNRAYEQLVSLLLGIRECHRRLGTLDDFTAYITDLRAAQKRKRNLMRLMDDHGLSGS
ncbi:SWIM zinc finger family protein [Streptomyces yangpuensis]|uniref:SWIM zinc finger family protein n=1 Tax=Streptomyces yangpuensis TaxID=1648182 RepID=A0ABY5Q3Y9_9ACTN|nr:SWIM zinc finger family protein [Streptomyces yangpuensis]UUY50373.1 SWIM zinc finger family protein [Streptomyces yangpuensis]